MDCEALCDRLSAGPLALRDLPEILPFIAGPEFDPTFESSEGHTALTAALSQMHAGVSRALELVVVALLARGCDQFQEAGPATEPIDPQEAVAGTALAQHFQDALRPGYAPPEETRRLLEMNAREIEAYLSPKQMTPPEPTHDEPTCDEPAIDIPSIRPLELGERDQATLAHALVTSTTSDAPTDTLIASLAFRVVPAEVATAALARLEAPATDDADGRAFQAFLKLCAAGDGEYMHRVLVEIAEHNARTLAFSVRAHELGA